MQDTGQRVLVRAFLLALFCLMFSAGTANAGRRTFTVDSTCVLRNPCSGWAIYIDGYIPKSADQYYADMEACGALRYATHLYIRLPWALYEPEEGKYAWEHNPEFMKLIQGARERKIKLAFRVYYDNKDYKIQTTPLYVRDAGAQGYQSNTRLWTPYADDSVYLAKLERFISAMGQRFNDPSITDYVDGCGLGTWGEGFNTVFRDPKNKDFVYRFVARSFAEHFSRVICVINAHSFIGNDLLRSLAQDEGYIFRHDAIGSKVWFEPSQSQLMMERFPEECNIAESMWWLNQGPNTAIFKNEDFRDWRHVMEFTVAEAKRIRANTLDLRNVAEASQLWMKQAPDLVEQFNAQAGYRLSPIVISYPSKIHRRSSFTVSSTWVNSGWGVMPNKNPHWHNKYKVAYCLMRDGETTPVQICVDPSSDPSDWTLEKDGNLESVLHFDVPRGTYNLYVAIVDTTRSNEPAIELAIKDRRQGTWVEVGKVRVTKATT